MRNIFSALLISSLLMACGSSATNNSSNNNANVKATETAANSNTNTNTANANGNSNTAKPEDSGPKRISFGKGQSNAAENVMLTAGQSMKFVIGVKAGQRLSIDSSAKEATISIITKGKTSEVSEGDGYYDATTTSGGDIIFIVSNGTKKPFKSSINVAVNDEEGE